MKKRTSLHWVMLLLGIVATTPAMRADWFDDDAEMADLFGNLDDDDTRQDPCCDTNGGRFGPLTEDDIISFISVALSAPVFQKTFRPRTRDALYQLPIYRRQIQSKEGFFANFFFNRFPRFTLPLVDQFALDVNEDALQNILETLKAGGFIGDVDGVTNLLPLLKQIGTDEHRVGFLLQYNAAWDPYFIELDTSLHLAERNLQASPAVQAELEALIASIIPQAEDGDFDTHKEFVRIRYGLGDTRLRVGVKALDRKHLQVRTGVGLIVPGTISSLRDGHFDKIGESENNDILDFLINDVRRLVLNPEISNKHFATNYFLDIDIPLLNDKMHIRSRLSYDSFMSAHDDRLIMAKTEVTPEQVQRECGDAGSNIIAQFREQYIIPCKVVATISPGDIFYWTVMLDYVFGDFRWGLGYDYWMQQREQFQRLPCTPLPVSSIRITDATAPHVSSHKFGAELGYNTGDVDFSLGYDRTVVNHNLSDDWSLYGSVHVRF